MNTRITLGYVWFISICVLIHYRGISVLCFSQTGNKKIHPTRTEKGITTTFSFNPYPIFIEFSFLFCGISIFKPKKQVETEL